MGIDNIEILFPPPREDVIHDPTKCGGKRICLTCSIRAYQKASEA